MSELNELFLRTLKNEHRNGKLYLGKYDGKPLEFSLDQSTQIFAWDIQGHKSKKDATYWQSHKHFDDLHKATQGQYTPADMVRKGYGPDDVMGIYEKDSPKETDFLRIYGLKLKKERGEIPVPISETWWFKTSHPYELKHLREAGLGVDDFHPGLWKEAGFAPGVLQGAGKSLEEVRAAGRDAEKEKSRYTPAELKTVWPAGDVDRLFTKQELDKQLYKDARANQVGVEELKKVKEEFLEAAAKLYGHRIEKRDFKKGLGAKTLEKLERDLAKNRKRYERMKDRKWKFRFLEWQEELEAELATLKKQKQADQKHYDEIKKKFLDLIDKRVKYTDDQLKKLRSDLKKPIAALDNERIRELKRIERMNKEWAQAFYPVNTARAAQVIRLRDYSLGDGIVNENIHHPYHDEEKGSQRKGSPLNNLIVLDKKSELLNWSIDAFEGEQQALKDMRDLVKHSESLWKFVDRHEKWYPTLLNLGESVTEVSRSSRLLKGKGPSQWKKEKAITGARTFTLEFGASAGVLGGAVMLGLNIVVSGALTVEDDRRMRANLTLKLVPSFNVSVGGPTKKLFEFSASLGFTVTSQTYAFVDHQHFAYYVSFRIANLLNFTDKFTRYGNSALHQHISLYDPDIKTLMSHIIGKDEMKNMELYLSKKPLVKVCPVRGSGLIPSVDLGFKEGIVGTESKASANYAARVYQKSELVLPVIHTNGSPTAVEGSSNGKPPDSSGLPPASALSEPSHEKSVAHEPSGEKVVEEDKPVAVGYYQIQDGPEERKLGDREFWHYTAKGDGHCFYYSFLFLADLLSDGTFGDDITILRQKIAEQAGRLIDAYPNDTFWGQVQDRTGRTKEDFLRSIRDVAGADYAGAEVLDAASIAYKVRITVYTDPKVDPEGGVQRYPLGTRDGHVDKREAADAEEWDEKFMLYTSMGERKGIQALNHYEPLIPKDRFTKEAAPKPRQRLVPYHRPASEKVLREKVEVVPPADRPSEEVETGLHLSLAPVPIPPREDEGMVRNPHLLTRVRRGHSMGASFEIEGPSWMKTAVAVSYTHIVSDGNPDNDGNYINFKLTQGIFGRTPLSFPEDKNPPYLEINLFDSQSSKPVESVLGHSEDKVWQDMYKAKDDIAGKTPSDSLDEMVVNKAKEGLQKAAHELNLDKLKTAVQEMMRETFREVPSELAQFAGSLKSILQENVEVSLNMSTRHVEFNLARDGTGVFRLQYIRWVYQSSSVIRGKGTVYQDPFVTVDVAASISWSKAVALQEALGDNTLTYLVTVFNGLKQREGGMDQWKAFLHKHPNNLRKLFLKITKKGTNVRSEAEAMEKQANDFPSIWHDGDGPAPTTAFVAACEAALADLSLKKEFSSKGQKKYGFRRPQAATVKAVDRLSEELTILFERSQDVAAAINARVNPWRQYRIYLNKPAGKVRFNLKYRGSEYQVFKPLLVTFNREGPYQHFGDILKNRTLANAYTALPYYQHNFEIEFKIVDLKDKEIAKLSFRQPNGLDVLQYELFKAVRDATEMRKGNLPVVEALVNLHFGLRWHFEPWLAKIRESKEDSEALINDAVDRWDLWRENPNRDPDYAEMLEKGAAPPVDAFEEVLKEIRGPFIGFRT